MLDRDALVDDADRDVGGIAVGRIISGVQLKALAVSIQPAGSGSSRPTGADSFTAAGANVRRVELERPLGVERQGQRTVRTHLQVGDDAGGTSTATSWSPGASAWAEARV